MSLASEKTISKIDRFTYEEMAMSFWKWAYLIGAVIIVLFVVFACLIFNSGWNRTFG